MVVGGRPYLSSQIPKRIVPTPPMNITTNSSLKITATRATHTEITADDGGQISKTRMAVIVGGHAGPVKAGAEDDPAQSGEIRAMMAMPSATRKAVVQMASAACLRAAGIMPTSLPGARWSLPLGRDTMSAPGQSASLSASSSSVPSSVTGSGIPSKCRVTCVCSWPAWP